MFPLPTLGLLDNFNRTNANTLGANWSQFVLFGSASIRVNSNQASAALLGWAMWNGAGNVFGAKQGAAFTFANATVNNSWLILKASGGSLTTPANYVRVLHNAGSVAVATTNNGGALSPTYVTRATFPATFASGDTLSAVADATGTVFVWKTTGATTTFVGSSNPDDRPSCLDAGHGRRPDRDPAPDGWPGRQLRRPDAPVSRLREPPSNRRRGRERHDRHEKVAAQPA